MTKRGTRRLMALLTGACSGWGRVGVEGAPVWGFGQCAAIKSIKCKHKDAVQCSGTGTMSPEDQFWGGRHSTVLLKTRQIE